MKTKLTKANVAALGLPDGKADAIHFDTEIPGFGIRFRRGAQGLIVTWVLQHKRGRETLGRYPAIGAQQAREWAAKVHAQIALGHDPAAAREAEKQQQAETVGAILRTYLPGKKLRPRSRVEIERHLLKNAASLHHKPVAQVTRREIANCLAAVTERSGTSQANRTRGSLSAFFTWCCQRGLAETNPVAFTGTHKEEARHRVLNDVELRQVWNALPDNDYGRAVKLLILTGQRRQEIGKLRWSEIDLARGVISLSGERTKNGKPHDLPISAPVRAILESQPRCGEFVFGRNGVLDWSHKKIDLDAKLSLEHWVLHDLRRTAATRMVDLGILPHAVEAVLNHYGHRSGVAGVYNRSLYAAEKAQALARWAEHVMAVVVPLSGSGKSNADRILRLYQAMKSTATVVPLKQA